MACEVLICVRDKACEDFYMNARSVKRGDVLIARGVSWPWGIRELDHPDLRIIRFTGVDLANASALQAMEPEQTPEQPSLTRQFRAFRFDIDNLPPDLQAFIADDERAEPIAESSLSLDAFLSLKILKAPIPDPAIIGDPQGIIG